MMVVSLMESDDDHLRNLQYQVSLIKFLFSCVWDRSGFS